MIVSIAHERNTGTCKGLPANEAAECVHQLCAAAGIGSGPYLLTNYETATEADRVRTAGALLDELRFRRDSGVLWAPGDLPRFELEQERQRAINDDSRNSDPATVEAFIRGRARQGKPGGGEDQGPPNTIL